MKPHPRIRTTVKWGGAIVSMTLLELCVLSMFHRTAGINQYGNEEGFDGGRYFFQRFHPGALPVKPKTETSAVFQSTGWCWSYLKFGDSLEFLSVSLWPPFAVSLLITATAWRLDTLARRRARIGRCPKCHYDRTGLATGAVCPECGRAGSP